MFTIMDCEGPDRLCKNWVFYNTMNFDIVNATLFGDFSRPLEVDEVIKYLRDRWNFTYDLQLVVRGKNLYLQIMWGYLEQKSFPLDEDAYRKHLFEVLEVVNRLGNASMVREWLLTTNQKPRVGIAITIQLKSDDLLGEFII